MTSPYLQQLLRWCHRGVILFGLIATVRVGYVAWTNSPKIVTRTPVPTALSSATGSNAGRRQSLPESLIEQQELNPSPLPSKLVTHPAATTTAAAPTNHIFLAIHESPARSEVRLNGITLGHTPFVGEITCKRGEPLEFVLIPPRGAPNHRSYICDGAEITIKDKTR